MLPIIGVDRRNEHIWYDNRSDIFTSLFYFFFVAKNSEAKVDSDDSDDGKLKTQSLFVEYW